MTDEKRPSGEKTLADVVTAVTRVENRLIATNDQLRFLLEKLTVITDAVRKGQDEAERIARIQQRPMR